MIEREIYNAQVPEERQRPLRDSALFRPNPWQILYIILYYYILFTLTLTIIIYIYIYIYIHMYIQECFQSRLRSQ